MRQASIGPDFPGRLNPAQPSGPAAGAATAQTSNAPAAVAEEVGILFLRADGGDPQQLQADSGSTLVFIARRDGEGRAYRNGREVGLEAAVKESAAEIALAQFGAATSGEIAVSTLPAGAQAALRQYPAAGVSLRIVFSHMTNRADTGRVSDQRAAKILALETSANAHSRAHQDGDADVRAQIRRVRQFRGCALQRTRRPRRLRANQARGSAATRQRRPVLTSETKNARKTGRARVYWCNLDCACCYHLISGLSRS